LAPQFVEELCRFHTASAMATRRVAKVDIWLGAKKIHAGEGIIAATQSGNRDEDIFPDPDTFNMHRIRRSEQAFGYGYGDHRCIAEWLARAELETVFGMHCYYYFEISSLVNYEANIFQRLPHLQLAVDIENVKYSPPTADVGILELPVTLE
jgi:nitric oxide reductase